MPGFGVVLVAVDDYPDPPGPLPSSRSAARFAELLGGDRGGTVLASVVAGGEQDVVDTIRRWAADADRPASSVVYLVGHGRGDGLDHEFLVPADGRVVAIRTARLAQDLQRDWQSRQVDPASWTLLVLDCCDSELGVTNLVAELTARYPKKPRRLGLWPVAPGGASRTGDFVDAFERALGTFTENDERIPLGEVFRRIRHELGDLESAGFLPDEAALAQVRPDAPVVMPLDVHAELRRAVADRPAEVRSHFLAKAQGSEVGEVAWHFTGRAWETDELCSWLRDGRGMKVVTGEAGSGKSALLGHLVVLADPVLVGLYADSGLAPHLRAGPRPPDHAFGAVVHLTGKTAVEAVAGIASQIGLPPTDGDGPSGPGGLRARIDDFTRGVRRSGREGTTVLVDALDESQDPQDVAAFLREVAAEGVLRVLVGTRRSLSEGPDRAAVPAQREILDALGVDDADLLVVERERSAVYAYARQRLGRDRSPYLDRPDLAGAVARRIAALDQPFLFARLATAELLARPALEEHDPELAELLSGGHRGVFAAALDRIAAADPVAVAMVGALAYARGRGVPRTGGIWLDAARAVGGAEGATDEAEDAAMALAGPYITLDAEAGQSTYRLAHQTFVEHFHADPDYGAGHRRIAAGLAERHRAGRWAGANHYAVRYTPEHLVADADRTPPDAAGLRALVTDAGWLARAVGTLGVDRTVEVVAAARRVAAGGAAGTAAGGAGGAGTTGAGTDAVEAVERALRRSRSALARDPDQLAGQLHARLKDEPGSELAELGSRAADELGRPWLRVVDGSLDWRSDLETNYEPKPSGKLRGLAFGHVDERPVVAIAIDHRVVLWDPRQGVPDEAGAIDVGDHKPTALAVARIGDRPVVVTTAAYEGWTELWDARSGRRLAGTRVGLGHALAVGAVGGRLVVAGAGMSGEVGMLDAETLEPVEPVDELGRRNVRGFAPHHGRLVALCVDEREAAPGDPAGAHVLVVTVVDAETGGELWRSVELRTDYNRVDVAAGGDVGGTFVVVAGVGGMTYWLTEGNGHVEEPGHRRRLRALAIGPVDGRTIVASAPDHDTTALVELDQLEPEETPDGVALFRPRTAGGLPPASAAGFGDVVLPAGLAPPHWQDRATAFSPDRPEEWPHTAAAEGEIDGRPVLVTGSVEGAVWVWDTTGGRPRAVAGPFVDVTPFTRTHGWLALAMKPGVPTADSVAFALTDRGPVVAVACGGGVRLHRLPGGEAVECPVERGTVVDAVALGRLHGRDVLVTGSKAGVLAVWGVDPLERVAVLTLDDPIVDLRIRPGGGTGGGRVAVLTGADRVFTVELVQDDG